SNTAISLKILNKVSLHKDISVVDWYFFSILLIENKKAIFTNETITFYRQYDKNLVGLKSQTTETIKKGIEIKKKHYLEIDKYFNKNFFNKELSELSNYNVKLSNMINNPLWWEMI
ncbi:hypothetical protein CRU99_13615, partial [Malaciobacter mytili]|uniref:hypothetical protein n=1 Tax=Malaciobacter mytili TaxID=603050 RepID=UPI00102741C1